MSYSEISYLLTNIKIYFTYLRYYSKSAVFSNKITFWDLIVTFLKLHKSLQTCVKYVYMGMRARKPRLVRVNTRRGKSDGEGERDAEQRTWS